MMIDLSESEIGLLRGAIAPEAAVWRRLAASDAELSHDEQVAFRLHADEHDTLIRKLSPTPQ
jgi:hypothetical protein